MQIISFQFRSFLYAKKKFRTICKNALMYFDAAECITSSSISVRPF
jgi:hypothetical protein